MKPEDERYWSGHEDGYKECWRQTKHLASSERAFLFFLGALLGALIARGLPC